MNGNLEYRNDVQFQDEFVKNPKVVERSVNSTDDRHSLVELAVR